MAGSVSRNYRENTHAIYCYLFIKTLKSLSDPVVLAKLEPINSFSFSDFFLTLSDLCNVIGRQGRRIVVYPQFLPEL